MTMAKLTKAQTKVHKQALELLCKDVLTFDDKWFVLEHFHEGAHHMQGERGAFFTPVGLARDFAIDAFGGGRVLDVCAGIGGLAYHAYHRAVSNSPDTVAAPQYVCLEQNPAYVEIGRKILPEAEWICADVADLPTLGLGYFDSVISNPPFGAVSRDWTGPRYTGRDFEFHLVDMVSDMASYGAFILPQQSAGFQFSGVQCYERRESSKYRKFSEQTGISFEAGCGIDTTYHGEDWHGVAPRVEVCCVDFEETRESRAPASISLPHQQEQLALAV